MTAITNNRRRPWPRSPMTAVTQKKKIKKKNKKKKKTKKKKKNKKKKKKKRRSWRRSPITGVAHDRGPPWPGRPWPRSPEKKK